MWICCQLGAREHYAVARALHEQDRLASLYTDFWAGPLTRSVAGKLKSGALRSLATRFHPGLADTSVESWNFRSLYWETVVNKQAVSNGNSYHGFIEVGRRFAMQVRAALEKRMDLGSDSIFFAYDTGALEAMQWCKQQGLKCVLNQMDPSRVEVEIVRAEEKHWSGWSAHPQVVPEEYFHRREQEWLLADRVVVNSEWSRQALLQQGVPAEKLVVIPLCYEPQTTRQNAENRKQQSEIAHENQFQVSGFRFSASRPLRVLFLGQVIPRKGIQYLIQAARLLEKENIQFDVVGPLGISPEAIASAPRNLTFHGRTNRDQAVRWYQQADVFVLPTLSDGFAITQLEAMAYGLPVVTTPNCGDVVTDGMDGFVIPVRDSEALVQILLRYLAEPGLLRAQQTAALEKSKQFTLARLAANLLSLEASLMNK